MAITAQQAFQRALGASKTYVNKHINSLGGVSLDDLEEAIREHNNDLDAHSKQRYSQTISTASDTWAIQHNLDTSWYDLTVIMVDENFNIVYGAIDHNNSTNNLLIVKFAEPIMGKIMVKK